MDKVYIKCDTNIVAESITSTLYALFDTEYDITVNDIRKAISAAINSKRAALIVDDEIDDETAYGWHSLSPDDLKLYENFDTINQCNYIFILPSPVKFNTPAIKDSTDGKPVRSKTSHEWLVEQVKLAGQELIDKAEELVPAGDSAKDYYISIDFDPDETPAISVSFGHYDSNRVNALIKKGLGKQCFEV